MYLDCNDLDINCTNLFKTFIHTNHKMVLLYIIMNVCFCPGVPQETDVCCLGL